MQEQFEKRFVMFNSILQGLYVVENPRCTFPRPFGDDPMIGSFSYKFPTQVGRNGVESFLPTLTSGVRGFRPILGLMVVRGELGSLVEGKTLWT